MLDLISLFSSFFPVVSKRRPQCACKYEPDWIWTIKIIFNDESFLVTKLREKGATGIYEEITYISNLYSPSAPPNLVIHMLGLLVFKSLFTLINVLVWCSCYGFNRGLHPLRLSPSYLSDGPNGIWTKQKTWSILFFLSFFHRFFSMAFYFALMNVSNKKERRRSSSRPSHLSWVISLSLSLIPL